MREYMSIIKEFNERVDAAWDRAFDIVCDQLNFHESGHNHLYRKLSSGEGFRRKLDPRDSLNRWTPQQWQDLQLQVGQFFDVHFENGVLEIAARGTPSA